MKSYSLNSKMRMQVLLVGFLAFVILISNAQATKSDIIVGQVSDSSKSIKIPTELVGVLEKFYISEVKRLTPDISQTTTDAELAVRLKRKALKSKVIFVPVDSPVLPGKVVFETPHGGGVIHLNKYVRSQYPGRFQVFFSVAPVENSDEAKKLFQENLKVFFVSQSIQNQVKGKNLGSGCNRFMDVTNYFKNTVFNEGILVDVMHLSHVSALAGIYVFAFVYNDQLHLSTIQITDKDHSHLICAE